MGDYESRKESQGKKSDDESRKESQRKKSDNESRKESQGKKRALGDDESRKESQGKKRASGKEKEKGRNTAGGSKRSPRKSAQCADKESRFVERPITSESGTETEDDSPVFCCNVEGFIDRC